MSGSTSAIPRAFIWRRVHSLMGLWLAIFLLEHLLTNSQAALWLGDNGSGFVRMVNALHNLPYLQVIEIFLLGVPLLIHAVWGVKYALTGRSNAKSSNGAKPSLPQYGRNRAYSWQRITSWILLVGIVCHVAKFRFLEYPEKAVQEGGYAYFTKVSLDAGLDTLSERLHVQLYNQAAVAKEVEGLKAHNPEHSAQQYAQHVHWVKTLAKIPLSKETLVAVSPDFGTATLLAVRDVFKSPLYVALYTIFVLAACFHAFNGLWTFMITWGWVIKQSAQKKMGSLCIAIMLAIGFLGLAAVWGTYWINLRY